VIILPEELVSRQMPEGQGGSARTVTPVTVPGSPGITDFSKGQGEAKVPIHESPGGVSETRELSQETRKPLENRGHAEPTRTGGLLEFLSQPVATLARGTDCKRPGRHLS